MDKYPRTLINYNFDIILFTKKGPQDGSQFGSHQMFNTPLISGADYF